MNTLYSGRFSSPSRRHLRRPFPRLYAAPCHLNPLTASATSSSPIPLSFPSLSHSPDLTISRRSRGSPPRCLPRRRLTGETLRHFLVTIASTPRCASTKLVHGLFGGLQRRYDADLATPPRGTPPFISRRRSGLRLHARIAPSPSPCRPGHRHLLSVAWGSRRSSPEFSPGQRRPSQPPLPRPQGEAPPPQPPTNSGTPRGSAGPRPGLRHADALLASLGRSAPVK